MFWIPLAMMAASAAVAAYSARQQNKALAGSADATSDAANLQRKQVAQAAALEREKRLANYRASLGRLRVAAAENGTGSGGGTFAALELQEAHRSSIDRKIVTLNEENADLRIVSEATAGIQHLNNQIVNPILASFTGGLQGFSSGLAIESAIKESGAADDEEAKANELRNSGGHQ